MTWDMAPAVVAVASLVVWVAVGVTVARCRHCPRTVRAGALVAVYAAVIGGVVTSAGYVDLLDPHTTAMAGTAWRSAVLVAGLHALMGAARAARERR